MRELFPKSEVLERLSRFSFGRFTSLNNCGSTGTRLRPSGHFPLCSPRAKAACKRGRETFVFGGMRALIRKIQQVNILGGG